MSTKFFDQIINDSDAMRDFYLKEFNCDSEVIAYGANIRESEKPELIKKWELVPNDYYLIVGRLIPDNNADVIVKEYCLSSSNKKLVIVGDVPYKDNYADKIKAVKDPRLIFTGYVTDQNELAELYHNSYAYIHGHEFGGTNPTMLKALAYGCAILAIDTVFTQEMLNGKEHGIFFTKEENSIKDVIEFADENAKLLSEFKQKSRLRIKQNYTWEKITNQYFDLFKMLTNNS